MFATIIFVILAVFGVGSANIDPQIIGGSVTTISKYPYQVALLRKVGGAWSIYCGGSILSKSYVLTSAHCTNDYLTSPTTLSIRAGSSYHANGGQWYYVRQITQHGNYKKPSTDFDIAIVVSFVPFTYSTLVKPIGLGTSFPNVGAIATVTGWGVESSGSTVPSSQLKVAFMPFQAFSTCKASWTTSLTNNMVCAGYYKATTATCLGDSGGPLTYGGKLLGLVSFGVQSCTDVPTVFTNVPAFATWIRTYAIVDL